MKDAEIETEECPPFAPSLMESTRAIGYSLEAAIADIIDNSIAAGASKVDVLYHPGNDPYIGVLDNGCGMGKAELKVAMRYGSRSPVEAREDYDLGRYGLGMKTASLSQCRQLTVVSVKNKRRVACRWDLDYVHKTEKWLLQLLGDSIVDRLPKIEELDKYCHGTLVIWRELDKLEHTNIDYKSSLSKRMDSVEKHLSLVFHRYLSGEKGLKKISISFNGRALEPVDPFLKEKSFQVMDVEEIFVSGARVTAIPYLLPHISKLSAAEIEALGGKEGFRKNQGFYIYRNRRLLTWGTWFRLARKSDLSKLARVQVDIPNSLDDLWSLDIKKSVALPPEVVMKRLSAIIDKCSLSSRQTWTYRGKKELPTSKIQGVWAKSKAREGGFYYEVNKNHPLIEQIYKRFPLARPQIERLLDMVASGLPLNSLYQDLTNDVKIENEKEKSPAEILALLKALVAEEKTASQRTSKIKAFLLSKPFCDYSNEISAAMRKGYFND